MKKIKMLVVSIIVVAALHLLPLIPPDIEIPDTGGVKTASIEQANRLYTDAMYEDAIKNYYVLAHQGDAHAQYRIGFMYLHGQGIKSDICESTRWFDKSARDGNGFAQFELGRAYYEGYGVARNHTKAYLWIRESLKTINQKATKAALKTIQAQYEHIQEDLSMSNKLNEATSLYESWQFRKEGPVDIVRLRKIPILDQFLREFYGTFPCDYYKN